MTRGMKPAASRVAALGAALTAMIALAACGGSSHKSSTTSTTKSSTTTTTTTTTKKTTAPAAFLIALGRSNTTTTPSSTITAKPGDNVNLIARVPGAKKSAKVTFDIPSASSTSLTVNVSSDGHSASIKISSSTGKPLSLVRLHYLCQLPPVPSFCPAKSVSSGSSGYKLTFSATRKTPITVLSTAGPVSLKIPKSSAPGSSVVPAYKVTELAKVLPPAGQKPSTAAPTSSVTAKSGELIELISRVTAKVHGATQPLTITINQGPASTITVSAQIKGGVASQATIKGSGSAKLTLVTPHYICYLPPFPSFCPASSTSAGSHKYTLTFPVAPGAATPSLLVDVQAG